jgi:hypothetical protein
MKLAILVLSLLVAQIPKNDPNGIWEAETGSKFNIRLAGSDLHVQIVEGSNPRFLKYELTLKNQGEANTYKGGGFFLAKLQNGKECKFDSDWEIVVVSPQRILGSASTVVPDPDTCDVKERGRQTLDLKKN